MGKAGKEKKEKKSKTVVEKVKAVVTKLKGKKAAGDDSGAKVMTAKKATKKLEKKLGRKPTDDEVSAFVEKINKKRSKKGKEDTKRKTEDDTGGAADEDAAPPKKKAKKDKKTKKKEAEAETADTSAASGEGDAADAVVEEEIQFPIKPAKKVNTPFRRVISENIVVSREFQDNTYEGTFGGNGWGAKASEILLTTKGKSFRHEKTKKKRGSYKGGEIDANAINSTKVTFADDW